MSHPVHFVGAGPGAEDLITLRGADLLARADVVLYAGSLVNPALLQRCRSECAVFDSASMPLDEQVALMTSAVAKGKLVVRLHTGEPSVYGAIGEQMDALTAAGIACKVTPGVSSVFAAAASLGCELTRPGLSQSVILTRTPGRTPMPAGETPAGFARAGGTLAFFLSAGHLDALTTELTGEGGLAPETPAAVVYRASWPDEIVVRGTLVDIAAKVREAGIRRQALVLVGQALAPGENTAPSLLYDRTFAHGYRATTEDDGLCGPCAVWTFTPKGLSLAQTLRSGLGIPITVFAPDRRAGEGIDETFAPGGFESLLASRWNDFAAHIIIGATGIAVRAITSPESPKLLHKAADPAVVSCPDTGAFALPLVSGHLGGANRLARRVAGVTGGDALISTATDIHDLPALDEAAALESAVVLNPEALRPCHAALADGRTVDFVGPEDIFARRFPEDGPVQKVHKIQKVQKAVAPVAGQPAVIWLTGDAPLPAERHPEHLYIRQRTVVLGVGCRKDADPVALEAAARDLLLRNGIPVHRLAAVATCTLKAHEPAVVRLSEALGVPLRTYAEAELETVPVPTPSARVAGKVGTPSVAEAAALHTALRLAPHAELTTPKQSLETMTLALATGFSTGMAHARTFSGNNSGNSCNNAADVTAAMSGALVVVGLGSGSPRHITPEVRQAIERCDCLAGYSGYLDLIRPLTAGKTLIETPMRGEVARCTAALEAAAKGRAVCLVCSGDPGVLAMAGLIHELRLREPRFASVPVAAFPGITAANLAASALGAPLQNGFCLVSLSDLLVPADEVRANVHAAAQTALPLVLYNPAGRKRRALMEESLDFLTAHRGPETPAAFVREAGRPNEQRWIGRLGTFPRERVDMSTLIVVGGPRTRIALGSMFEERGYMGDGE